MSVTKCELKSRSANESMSDKYTKSYTLVFYLESDNIADGPLTILNCGYLPAIGTYYAWGNDIDYGVRCTERSPTEIGVMDVGGGNKGMQWEVTITYSTLDAKERDSEQPTNPLLNPPNYSGQSNSVQLPLTVDIENVGITNSAGSPFKTLEKESSQAIIAIEKNYPAPFDFNYVVQNINDRLNSDAWKGFDPYTLKIKLASWSLQKASIPDANGISQTIDYISAQWHIEAATNKWGWKKRIFNKGPKYWTDDDKLVGFLDKQGQPYEGWLKEDGSRFTDDEVKSSDFEPTYEEYDIYDSISFAGLGI